jgi:hypothetical protein
MHLRDANRKMQSPREEISHARNLEKGESGMSKSRRYILYTLSLLA